MGKELPLKYGKRNAVKGEPFIKIILTKITGQFSKATYDDFEILFSIPTCDECFINSHNELKFYNNHLTRTIRKKSRKSKW